MKRVIALLLALMMLPIFTVATQAAGEMSKQDFKDVLLGISTDISAEQGKADLIRAYRNVSTDQLNAMKTYFNAVDETVVGAVVSPNTAVLSNDEAKVLALGFIKLMTFTNEKDGAISNNNIGDADINRAVDAFCDPMTIGTAVNISPNAVTSNISFTYFATGYSLQSNLYGASSSSISGNLPTGGLNRLSVLSSLHWLTSPRSTGPVPSSTAKS